MINEAMRLNPRYPIYYLWNLGHAYLLTKQYPEAIAALEKVVERNRDFWPSHIFLAVCYSETGQEAAARAEASEVLRINPGFSLKTWEQKCPFKNQAVLENRLATLRKIGLK
jgi:adenylate cyclase